VGGGGDLLNGRLMKKCQKYSKEAKGSKYYVDVICKRETYGELIPENYVDTKRRVPTIGGKEDMGEKNECGRVEKTL